MKSKKDLILETALDLFAKKGFNATSTSKIAKEAGVSEGLIFRHFTNKNGLLDSVLNLGKERGLKLFEGISEVSSPNEKLKYILQIPFNIPQNEYSFWKLLYSLKWQADSYDEELSTQLKKIVEDILVQLKYTNPALEAQFVMMLFDGIAMAVLLKTPKDTKEIQKIILSKYNLL
jgi:AcrR family transcriptional regulator